MEADTEPRADNHHGIDYTVDGEPQTTLERSLTPRQIITKAGLNPDERYLVQIQGRHQESYQNSPDEPIRLHEHEVFVTVFTGPVPVS